MILRSRTIPTVVGLLLLVLSGAEQINLRSVGTQRRFAQSISVLATALDLRVQV